MPLPPGELIGPPALPGLSISEASRLLGVPMPTLRSWERRYRLPTNARVTGRHRRYSEAELHELRLMRNEIARGTTASVAAETVRSLIGIDGPGAAYIADFLDASRRSDPAAVCASLDRAHAALDLGSCLDEVLLPALQQVGLWWQTGRCDVEQEHLTTEATRAWLESLIAFAPRPTRANPIVLACGPTDRHTVGLEALGTLLRYQGYPCRMLGARTSADAIAAAVHAISADGVVVVSHLNTGRARAAEALRTISTLDVQLFYAGNAFTTPRSRRGIPGTYLGPQLHAASALIQNALA